MQLLTGHGKIPCNPEEVSRELFLSGEMDTRPRTKSRLSSDGEPMTLKYPFRSMKVGQSFHVTAWEDTVRAYAAKMGRRLGQTFSAKKTGKANSNGDHEFLIRREK